MSRDDLKLKVELSSTIKFYIKIGQRSSLADLKRTINTILRLDFNIVLSNYSVRSIDGFEILNSYSIGEVLENGQIIIIDPFTCIQLSGNKKTPLSPISIKESSENDISPKTFQNIKKNRVTISEPNYQKIQPITDAIPTVPIESKNVANKVKAEEKVENNIQKVRIEENTQDLLPTPPKPDNFKGFSVIKEELNKAPGLKVDEASFKPLKKRRVDDDKPDIVEL